MKKLTIERLEIEHLAPYLPYGLMIKHYRKISGHNTVVPDFKLHPENILTVIEDGDKPILRPLSDLTKEIKHEGERFVPLEEMSNELYEMEKGNFDKRVEALQWLKLMISLNHLDLPYKIAVFLFKWHFDVFGLIDAGLAIDINVLKQ